MMWKTDSVRMFSGDTLREINRLTVVPAPTANWDFSNANSPWISGQNDLPLANGSGSTAVRVITPFGFGIQLNGTTDYLTIDAGNIGRLNIGSTTGKVTVAAWVNLTDTNVGAVAGCWDESGKRSYCLFYDLPTYGGDDMVCMHVSKAGGATPGYPFSKDYSAEPTTITRGSWQFFVGTYDGEKVISYLNGRATGYPSYIDNLSVNQSKNPYYYSLGLNATPAPFTVGAVTLGSGSMGNFVEGTIARLRVWNSALNAHQIRELYVEENPDTSNPSQDVYTENYLEKY